MLSARLTDLDELALATRDPVSRAYVQEAIDAYRAGAYRTTIVAVWIAVIVDIIDKLRELALAGDANAQVHVHQIDDAVASRNIAQLQKIENGLLNVAARQFEFLADHELEDLQRLQSDRNRSAHLAFVSEGQLFQPTPEQVRAHLAHAVRHLLQHQPVQGKSALARLVVDLTSEIFPLDEATAGRFLDAKYLQRARPALIRNLLTLLLKAILRGDDPDLDARRYLGPIVSAFRAVARRNGAIFEDTLREQVPRIGDTLDDTQLRNVFRLIEIDDRTWAWLSDAGRIRLIELTRSLIVESSDDPALGGFHIADLKPLVLDAVRGTEIGDRTRLLAERPLPDFVPIGIELMGQARGFREAEQIAEEAVLPLARYFSANDVSLLLLAAADNQQAWDAAKMPRILLRLYEVTRAKSGQDAWRSYVRKMAERDLSERYQRLTEAVG